MEHPDRHWRQQYLKTGTYEHELSRGNVRGAYPVLVYGKVILTTSVTDTLVSCPQSSVVRVPQGVRMSLSSSSGNDTAGGTGVHTVIVEYLDGNLDLAFEIVTMAGTTPVPMLATDVRWVQTMHMVTVGSLTVTAGNVSASHGGIVYGQIPAGDRHDCSSFFRVPRNKTLYVDSLYVGVNSGNAAARALVELMSSQVNGLSQQESGYLYKQVGLSLQDNSQAISWQTPLRVGAGSIVGFIATTDKGATITTGITGWIE